MIDGDSLQIRKTDEGTEIVFVRRCERRENAVIGTIRDRLSGMGAQVDYRDFRICCAVIVRESELMRAVRKIIKMYNASFNEVYKE